MSDYPHNPSLYAREWLYRWQQTNSHRLPLDEYCAHCGVLISGEKTCTKCGEKICEHCDPKDHDS